MMPKVCGKRGVQIRGGCTRTVILIGKYAIKLPSLHMGYVGFLKGILDNIQEDKTNYWKPALSISKTIYCNCTGLLLIAERVRHVKHVGLYQVELARLCAIAPDDEHFYKDDARSDNYGYDARNRLVKLDYARCQIT
jgi:hypothetical protein